MYVYIDIYMYIYMFVCVYIYGFIFLSFCLTSSLSLAGMRYVAAVACSVA